MWERRANQIQIFGNVWANTASLKERRHSWEAEMSRFCCVKCEGNKNSEICNQILSKLDWKNQEVESESRLGVFEVFHLRLSNLESLCDAENWKCWDLRVFWAWFDGFASFCWVKDRMMRGKEFSFAEFFS